MGLKELQILFNNPWATYYTGSPVSGRVALNIDTPKKVRELKIKIKGEANVKWTESESRTGSDGKSETHWVDYTSHENYFENKFSLAGESEIPPGKHYYDFTTILPPRLPSSYEGQYGHIRYTVKVTLDRPWKFDQECKAAFTVINPVDLNYVQEARMPLRVEESKTMGCCCCITGPLSASISAPSTGYTPGQTIPLKVEIINSSNTNVTTATLLFEKVVKYTARSPSHQTKEEKTELSKVSLSPVGANGSNSWSENITLPPLPATNTSGCSIMSIDYRISLATSVSGIFYRGLDIFAPIILGTVPLVSWGGAAPTEPQPPPSNPMGWTGNTYPELPPPNYEESSLWKADTIKDSDDNEHTMGVGGWVPRYPTFDFTPSAPPLSS